MRTIIITRKVDLLNLIKKINYKIIKCQVNVLINLKLNYGLVLHTKILKLLLSISKSVSCLDEKYNEKQSLFINKICGGTKNNV